MNSQTDEKRPRRPYARPELEQVNLVAEEAVLTSCKLQGGGVVGPNNIQCKGVTPTGGDCQLQLS